jgi:NAD-dependent DNA ligase
MLDPTNPELAYTANDHDAIKPASVQHKLEGVPISIMYQDNFLKRKSTR